MKQHQITRAYRALSRLASNMLLPVKDAYAIYSLMKAIGPTYETYVETQMKLISDYGGKVDKDGSIRFSSQEDTRKCKDALVELDNIDVELELPHVSIGLDEIKDQKMNAVDFGSLEGIVDFV